MKTMQVYSSELSKFTFDGKNTDVLVAGEGIEGVEVVELSVDVDPKSLVGGAAQERDIVAIKAGSKWNFREDRPLVESGNGGQFAFLTEAI
jgi:hypothetical protein